MSGARRRPRLIGLTGGLASGKSSVAARLAERGATVVDADQLAREVVEPGEPALAAIVDAFGGAVLGADGRLDRRRLGAVAFANAQLRARLEAITHPPIRALGAARVAEALAGGSFLVVYDIPLLFEGHREAEFDGVLLVYAAPAVQRARLQLRDGLDDSQARQRLAAQWPIDRKLPLATWVIDNSGTRTATRLAVARWRRQVMGTADAGVPAAVGGRRPGD